MGKKPEKPRKNNSDQSKADQEKTPSEEKPIVSKDEIQVSSSPIKGPVVKDEPVIKNNLLTPPKKGIKLIDSWGHKKQKR